MDRHERNHSKNPANLENINLHAFLRAEYEVLPDIRKEFVERARKKLDDGVYERQENVRKAARAFYECWSGS